MLNRLKHSLRDKLRVPLIEENSMKADETIDRLKNLHAGHNLSQQTLTNGFEKLNIALGRIETRQLSSLTSTNIQDYEFRVFSQWGEDGIIQFLIRNVGIKNKVFVEFGVEDYAEANTRFLLMNNNWSGLVMDSSKENVKSIINSNLYWRYNLTAVASFLDVENINKVIKKAGFEGEIGLLSIDVDGNDYWLWEAITVVNPQIVIVEYNHRFGAEKAVTIPYNKAFDRRKAHYSMLYAGASLKALCQLAKEKGYYFVGTNSAGNNAFFIRNDVKSKSLKALTAKEGFTPGKFREARDQDGNLSFISLDEEKKIIDKLPVVDLEKDGRRK